VNKYGLDAFALIILDYHMPLKSGLEVLREVNKISDEEKMLMPCVVFFSAYIENLHEKRVEAEELGA